ncbi:LysR substrate-binding domain-containing protein, partial [Pseudomonas savastanoi]
FAPHEQNPIPLAMFNTHCFCRDWACNALDSVERDYRIAYSSSSMAAITAVVSAGLAVTAQFQSLITADLRIIGAAEQLPELPTASIVLLRNPKNPSPITECMADYIIDGFKP